MTRPRTIGSLILALWMLAGLASAQDAAKPDPASVLGGPKVEDSADAPTGGSFGEPGMRQMTERTPMNAFLQAVRSLNEPSVTIGETTDVIPKDARLTDAQSTDIRAIQREFQRSAMQAMRDAGLSMDDVRAMRDDKTDPEQRRAMADKVKETTPDASGAQEKIYALLSKEQREIVERRIELWRADRFAKARTETLERKAKEQIAEQDKRQNARGGAQDIARLARALGISDAKAAQVRDALSGPPIAGEEGMSREEIAERRIDELPSDLLTARQKTQLKRILAERAAREGAPRQKP
jgi:hypothetical protein